MHKRRPFPLKELKHGLGMEFWTRRLFLLLLLQLGDESHKSQKAFQRHPLWHQENQMYLWKHTIDEIIKASNLPPGEQALLPARRLTTKVARPKKGRKKKGEGLELILEHHDIKDDPYYLKPPLPTHIK